MKYAIIFFSLAFSCMQGMEPEQLKQVLDSSQKEIIATIIKCAPPEHLCTRLNELSLIFGPQDMKTKLSWDTIKKNVIDKAHEILCEVKPKTLDTQIAFEDCNSGPRSSSITTDEFIERAKENEQMWTKYINAVANKASIYKFDKKMNQISNAPQQANEVRI